MRRIFFANVLFVALSSGCALFEGVDDPVYPEDATSDTDQDDTLGADADLDSSLEADPDTSTEETLDSATEETLDDSATSDTPDDSAADAADSTLFDAPDALLDSTTDSFKPDTSVTDSGADTKDSGIDSGADTKDAAPDTAPVCTASSYSCAGNDLRQCKTDGSGYTTLVTCPAGTCSAASGRCTFCTPGSLSCSGSQPTKCNTLGSAYAANGAACVAPQTCGGGGTTGVCGCTPTATATLCAGKDCGSVANGCGGTVTCGTCTAPRTCGGGGTANKCGGCGGTLPGPTMVNAGTYCIDSSEVTQAQYETFRVAKGSDVSGQPSACGFNSSYQPDTTGGCYAPTSTPNNPVRCLNWCDAYMYCKWAGKRLCGKVGGGANAYLDYADSAKSQWMRACSNGGTTTYPYGSSYVSGFCYTPNSSPGTPVNIKTYPSCTGTSAPYDSIFDMSGNVAEWEDSCASISGTWYCHARGGSYQDIDTSVKCDDSTVWPIDLTLQTVGLRCCAD